MKVDHSITLSADAEAQLMDLIVNRESREKRVREFEHDMWLKNLDDRMDLLKDGDKKYRRHVGECNWHQRIQTTVLVGVMLWLIKVLGQ